MGYEFHITRAGSYLEDSCPITLGEILTACDPLPEGFSVDRTGVVTAVTPEGASLAAQVGDYLVYEDRSDPHSRVHIYFDPDCLPFFKVGELQHLRPVILLAQRLGASVQGDEGEVYTLSGGRVTAEAESKAVPLLTRLARRLRKGK